MSNPAQSVGLELLWLLAGPFAVELVVFVAGFVLH